MIQTYKVRVKNKEVDRYVRGSGSYPKIAVYRAIEEVFSKRQLRSKTTLTLWRDMPKKKRAKKLVKVKVDPVWRGNMLAEGDWVSDGMLIFALSEVPIKNYPEAQSLAEKKRKGSIVAVQDKAWSLVEKITSVNDIIGEIHISKNGHVPVNFFFSSKATKVFFDNAYWDLADRMTGFNRIAMKLPKSPAILLRDNEVVGLLMPAERN
jgi:hypothetical protein